MVKYNNNQVFSFVSRCGHLWWGSRRFDCILLVFIRRWGRLVTRHLLSRMLRSDWLVFSSCDWCISILAVSVCCSLGGPLSYGSPVVVFLDRGHQYFWNFYSNIPVCVVRVKSYVNCPFDPECVSMRIMINELYFVPKQVPLLCYCLVSVFQNGGDLDTGKSDVSLMLFDSVLHRFSSLADVDFTAYTGNPVNHAILFSQLDSIFWSY